MPRIATALLFLAAIPPLAAAELKNATVQSWNQYCQWADAKVHRELADSNTFLIQNTLSPADRAQVQRQIESGEIFVQRMTGVIPPGARFDVPNGEIHHWWGSVLLRNATLPQLLQFLQDYNNHAGKFSDVERSRLLSAEGNHYRAYFRFRRSKSFVTVVYNTEQDCIYNTHGPGRASSQSIATKIAEVEDPGTPSEREKAPGDDRGFLWRLVSWWRFEQRGKDVIVELESASLSRDIPAVIKLIPGVSSYIRSTPRESLESVLTSVRQHMK
jgi:hypothetical protein